MKSEKEIVRKSFEICLKRRIDFAALFYNDLLTRHPQVQELFSKGHTQNQEKMLTEALISVVDKLDDAPWLNATMYALGVRHSKYGLQPEGVHGGI